MSISENYFDEALRKADEASIRVAELKRKLAATDYVAIKIAEGVATPDDYANILTDRKAWREEINALGG